MQGMMHHCLHPSVLDRQRAQLKQVNNNCYETILSLQSQGLYHGWPTLTAQYSIDMRGEEFGAASAAAATATASNSTSAASVQAAGSERRWKKRRAAKCSQTESSDDEEGEKRMKVGSSSAKDNKKRGASGDSSNSKDDSNNAKKPDYIHVRARRGEATDSHSLAERVRREKISERMKYLQGLVPGCNKITGKAGMLDEIINYVQSLQRQVEFLSMKLAAVNPRLEFNMEAFFSSKEMNLPCNSAISDEGMSSEMSMDQSSLLQLNSLQQAIASCRLDMAMNPAEITPRRTMSMPVSMPEPFMDSSFTRASSGWESELQNHYGVEFQQGRGFAFPF